MRIEQNRAYGVVTGDVIASSELSGRRRQALHEAMRATSKDLREAFAKSVPLEVDIFRGDSWQMLVTEPQLALRVGLFYRAGLRSQMQSHQFDIRMAIALGTIDFLPGERVSEGDGEAFRLSGEALESMSKSSNMSFRLPGHAEETALNVVVQLVDAIAARWSDKQALAVTGALQGWKQDRIAKACWPKRISQQAVAQHLDRASWRSVETALSFFEETLESILEPKQEK